eukprot:4544434-Pleurochrysis_carterae.AAC.2
MFELGVRKEHVRLICTPRPDLVAGRAPVFFFARSSVHAAALRHCRCSLACESGRERRSRQSVCLLTQRLEAPDAQDATQ